MTVYKGLLGYEDFTYGTGTFNRKARTGFDIPISKFSDLVDYQNGPLIDAKRYSSFTDAINAASGKILLISANISLPSGAISIPANISLMFLQSGSISKGSATSLTVTGPIVGNPMHQLFSGFAAGEVVFDKTNPNVVWFGFSTSSTSTVNSNAVQQAITSIVQTKGGTVHFPRGNYGVTPDIIGLTNYKNIELRGAGTGYGYQSSECGTILTFGTGTVGIDLYAANAYNKVCNMKISGNSLLGKGIKGGGAFTLEDISVEGCIDAGIWVPNLGNQFNLVRVSASYNLGYGLLVQGGGTTIFDVSKSNFRQNNIGIRIEGGQNFTFHNCVVESNTLEGMQIYRDTNPITNGVFNTCWFENNNNAANSYQITIDSVTHDYASGPSADLYFYNCNINAANSQKHLNIQAVRWASFYNCNMLGGDTTNGLLLGTYASYVYFYDGQILTPVGGTYGNRGGYINKGTGGISGEAQGLRTNMYVASLASQVVSTSGGLTRYCNELAVNITGTSVDILVNIPSGGRIIACQLRVDSALAAGELWDAAYATGATQSIATAQAVAQNTKVNKNFDTNAATDITSAVTVIRITKNGGGSFTTQGTIRAWVYYEIFETVASV